MPAQRNRLGTHDKEGQLVLSCMSQGQKKRPNTAHPEPVEGHSLVVRQANHERVIATAFSETKLLEYLGGGIIPTSNLVWIAKRC